MDRYTKILIVIETGEIKMAKYLVTWESDRSRWPADPKERGALSAKFLEITKQDMKDGKISDWGAFVVGRAGFAVCEGSGLELYKTIQPYTTHYTFIVHEVLSIDEVTKVMKSMTT